MSYLEKNDLDVFKALQSEQERQKIGLEMIASENYVSQAVLEAQGSIFTNKYAEGYPKKRYYSGCENIDIIENLGIERLKKLFKVDHANIQPHSGSQANMAVYFGSIKPQDSFLGMDLSHGGHLTHGSKVNFSGKLYQAHHYGVDDKTHLIDYNKIESIALKVKPRLMIAGHSSYPRQLNFEKFKTIADQVGCPLLVDMAHISGLVAVGEHPSPVPYADFVTSTTHKTLRGPRGGIILCQEKWARTINSQVFPGMQGGPLPQVMAAKAVAFKEALQPSFKVYIQQVLKNAKTLAQSLMDKDFNLITQGTDNHLILIDMTHKNLTGKEAEEALSAAGMTTNKNTIPNETRSPFITSGIRIGTPALTTRGMKEKDMEQIATWIDRAINHSKKEEELAKVRHEVESFCKKFPTFKA